jgi:hypothetical protein
LELINDSQLPDEVRAKTVKNVVQHISEAADDARKDVGRKESFLRTTKETKVQQYKLLKIPIKLESLDALCHDEQKALDKAEHLSAWWYYGLKKVKEALVKNKRYSDLAIEIKLEKPKAAARTLLQMRMELDDNLSKQIENGAAVLSPKVMEEALEIEKIRCTYLDNSLLVPSRANAAVR